MDISSEHRKYLAFPCDFDLGLVGYFQFAVLPFVFPAYEIIKAFGDFLEVSGDLDFLFFHKGVGAGDSFGTGQGNSGFVRSSLVI